MSVQNVHYCFPEGKLKALTMSYDDGRLQDERLVRIFNEHGIKGTFNLNYGPISRGALNRIPADRVRELYAGHEVATHGLNHSSHNRVPLPVAAAQILADRKGLETLTGGLVRGHCYPNGIQTRQIRQLLKQLGIAYARAWQAADTFDLPEDFYQWRPTCHHADPQLMEKARYFADFSKQGYLSVMMVAGHSFEFDLDDSWHVIEEFCAFMGGRGDIWYATNIEIVDYMTAANLLQFTADYQHVFNPSACAVWLEVDKQRVEVPAGAFVDLSAVE